jgi:Family of unknown function (DUF695)
VVKAQARISIMKAAKIALGVILLAVGAFFILQHQRTMKRIWNVGQRTYQGFPLFLRRPSNMDTSENRKRFPILAIITHEFTKRYPDGRPEAAYNESLFDFDEDIVTSFDSQQRGVPVLVETFAGKRHYYFYIAAHTDVASAIQPIVARYPNERLTWEVRTNANWSFLDKYAKEFF